MRPKIDILLFSYTTRLGVLGLYC